MSELKRYYKGNDADMLTAISSIVQAGKDYQEKLAARRPSWAEPFFTNLQKEIDLVVKTYMCTNSAKKLWLSTQLVQQIHVAAINNLEEIKVQIERNFRKDKITRDELLDELGYQNFFKAARKKDQGALVQLLYRFKKALTADVHEQLTAKGINPDALTTVLAFADMLYNANVAKEAFKGSRKASTDAAIIAFNEIYGRVMDVAVIVVKFLKYDEAKQERFNYSKVLEAQQNSAKLTRKVMAAESVHAA